jgi:hypothetical protein
MRNIFIILFILLLIVIYKNKYIDKYTDIPTKKNDYLLVQFDNREFFQNVIETFTNSDFNKLIKVNKEYCNLHNIDYLYVKKYDNSVPVYWMKVKIITHLINNTDYKAIIWMDTDAVFTHLDKSIFDLINNKSFYISMDPPQWNQINAGTWIVKNDEMGVKIMNDWMDTYDHSLWYFRNNSWYTDSAWVGDAYEQGTFNTIIYPKYKDYIEVLPWYIFNNNIKDNPNAYMSHYMLNTKELINQHY